MVIVTGANGFIGSAFIWELNEAHVHVLAATDLVSRTERPLTLQKRKYSHFLSHEELWPFLEKDDVKSQLRWIVHMGANSSTTETNKKLLWDLNTLYTEKLFKWCARHDVNLIYASSAATYGAGELGYSDATDPERLRPLNLYGESKVEFDRWALKQKEAPPLWYGLKFFNVYGPNEYHKDFMTSVAFKAFHQIKETGSLKLFKSYKKEFGDGDQKRDFVYIKDVTRWMYELIQKRPSSGIYNMGHGKARSWNDLAQSTFRAMNRQTKVEYIEMPDSVKNQYQYFTEAEMSSWLKAGMSPSRWSLEDGIRDYVENYLQNKDPYL